MTLRNLYLSSLLFLGACSAEELSEPASNAEQAVRSGEHPELGVPSRGTLAPGRAAFTPPRNPHVANSDWPVTHHDSYAQHHGMLPGVSGRGRVRVREAALGGVPLLLLDSRGKLIALSFTTTGDLRLSRLDPKTLEIEAVLELDDDGVFSGVYSFLDASDRVVLASGRSVLRYAQLSDSFALDGRSDLDNILLTEDKLAAVNVLYSGEIAFATRLGCVGVLPANALDGVPRSSVSMQVPERRTNRQWLLARRDRRFVRGD